jgi:hypothetical protein
MMVLCGTEGLLYRKNKSRPGSHEISQYLVDRPHTLYWCRVRSFHKESTYSVRSIAMRIICISVSVFILCSSAIFSFADEKSDCINKCANEKRSSDMYCPPAGGYSDEDHKQCIEKSSATYNECIKGCSPSQQPPAAIEPPPSLPDVSDLPDKLQ